MYRSSISCMLFPGQGAQYVGMTSQIQDFPAVRSLFKRANEILGYDLQSLCLTGPESKLQETLYCQPAMVVTSLAAASIAAKDGITNDVMLHIVYITQPTNLASNSFCITIKHVAIQVTGPISIASSL